jgi:hypothetical protein
MTRAPAAGPREGRVVPESGRARAVIDGFIVPVPP